MKILSLLTVLALSWTQSAYAVSFAIIDMQKIILGVEEGKIARAELEREIKAKEKTLMKEKQELDKLNEEWKMKAPLMSEDARFKKQKAFQERFMKLRNEEMKFQSEIKKKEATATQKIAMRVVGIVDKIAKTKNIDAVFEANSSGLLYVKSPVDLTPDVISAFNKKAKTAGK